LRHGERRRQASVSEQVTCPLTDQAAWRAGSWPDGIQPAANTVLAEHRPNPAGVVRAVA
jgi:hypothetical protein